MVVDVVPRDPQAERRRSGEPTPRPRELGFHAAQAQEGLLQLLTSESPRTLRAETGVTPEFLL